MISTFCNCSLAGGILIRACLLGNFKYCYSKWCENCDLKSVMKTHV